MISEGHKKLEEIATARSRPRNHGGPMISTVKSKKELSDSKKKNEQAERANILASFSGMTATEN